VTNEPILMQELDESAEALFALEEGLEQQSQNAAFVH
jgi:hypothetical protein